MFFVGLGIGLFVGVNLGIIFAALLFSSKRRRIIEETQMQESEVQKKKLSSAPVNPGI